MRWIVVAGAVNGAAAVALGAFAAHGLAARVDAAALAAFETAARYHLAHALALVAAGLVAGFGGARAAGVAAVLYLLGIVLFCGSLYVLGATGSRALVAMAPVGGLCLIAGWLVLAVAAAGIRRKP